MDTENNEQRQRSNIEEDQRQVSEAASAVEQKDESRLNVEPVQAGNDEPGYERVKPKLHSPSGELPPLQCRQLRVRLNCNAVFIKIVNRKTSFECSLI